MQSQHNLYAVWLARPSETITRQETNSHHNHLYLNGDNGSQSDTCIRGLSGTVHSVTPTPTEHQHAILVMIRRAGSLTISQIADELCVSHEALRQTLRRMLRAGLVQQASVGTGARGRPSFVYSVTPQGLASFDLPMGDTLATVLDLVPPDEAIEALAQRHVALWVDRLADLPTSERLNALTELHQDGDPFTFVDGSDLCRLFPAYQDQLPNPEMLCEAATRAVSYLLVRPTTHSHDETGLCRIAVGGE